jgi:ribosomal protein S13
LKFEHVLHIYWSNYFLFNTKAISLNTTLPSLVTNLNGIGKAIYKLLILRFEFIKITKNRKTSLLNYSASFSKSINILLSKMTSIDTPIKELQILHILRLYLLKTYQGKSHMLGKPVHGQRTWSNAWTSYNLNKELRTFVNKIFLLLAKNQKDEKINFKKIKKKIKKSKTNKTKTVKKVVNTWF